MIMEDIEKTNTPTKGDSLHGSEAIQVANKKNNYHKSNSTIEIDSPPTRTIRGVSWLLVIVSFISATFLWGLDSTIVANVQATFVERFHAINKLAWNSVSFFLGAAATVLSCQIYSRFNAKWIFIFCVMFSEIGSAICGAAPSESVFIAGRAICGVGGAGMYTGVLTLLSFTTHKKKRAFYIGAFALHATWRWGFYINLCISAACAPVYIFFLVPSIDPQSGSSVENRLKNVDWLRMILFTRASTTFIIGICFGGVVFPWESARTIALLVLAFIFFLAFAVQQSLVLFTNHLVFPVSIVKNVSVLAIFSNETCSATACFLPIYFIPLYVRGDFPLKAPIYLLPFICTMVATAIVCGTVVSKTSYWMLRFFYGGALMLIGGVFMYTVDEKASGAKVYGYSILIGSGSGAYIQMLFNAAQEFVEPRIIPAAVGLITCAQLAAPAITLSIANSVFLNKAVAQLKLILPPGAPTLQLVSGVGSEYFSNLDQGKQAEVLHAILQNMSNAYILIITSGALTLVMSSFLVLHSRWSAKC
ncbi:putative efflux pump antibiotic resistance protein [Bisporella sp. PMI_857]|nr:putative efflux pump antibiotic resistance protein [Bisporella sp. PMI_857]